MNGRIRRLWSLILETFREWSADEAPRLAAGLAYYAVFALAPILVIAIAIVGIAFGREAARGEIVAQIGGLVGIEGAHFVEELVEGASRKSSGILATILGLGALFLTVTAVFEQLLFALNTIWEVPPPERKRGLWSLVRQRLFSFGLVAAVGFLLLVSLVLSAGITALSRLWSGFLPGQDALWQGANAIVSVALVTVMFAMMYKYLPETDVRWRDVWLGALLTSILFVIGKSLIGLYLGKSTVASSYGAAGSLVLILLWIYYSAQILFLGAEFTEVYARHHGSIAGKQKPAGAALDPSRAPAASAGASTGASPFGQITAEPPPRAAPALAVDAPAGAAASGGVRRGLVALGFALLVARVLAADRRRGA